MIPATSIHFNDDGTAWLAVEAPEFSGAEKSDLATYIQADRPCDNCGGTMRHRFRQSGLWCDEPCPDCDGTGRHTFTIKVEVPPEFVDSTWSKRTHRVSVVPGMVLPITEDTDAVPKHDPHIIQFDGRCGGEPYTEFVPCDGRQTDDPITLPPDAKPGMWAVKLEVHQ